MKLSLPMLTQKDFITWSEKCEISHRTFLSEFNEKVWPALRDYGFSKDALLLYWVLNSVLMQLEETEERQRGEDEDSPYA